MKKLLNTDVRISRFWALPVAALLAGCGELAKTNIRFGRMPAATIPIGAENIRVKKVDAQITTALLDAVKNKHKVKIDLANIEGLPIEDILKTGSPIGYSLRNRHLNVGVPLAEALSRNADIVFREQLIDLARWDRDAMQAHAERFSEVEFSRRIHGLLGEVAHP